MAQALKTTTHRPAPLEIRPEARPLLSEFREGMLRALYAAAMSFQIHNLRQAAQTGPLPRRQSSPYRHPDPIPRNQVETDPITQCRRSPQ